MNNKTVFMIALLAGLGIVVVSVAIISLLDNHPVIIRSDNLKNFNSYDELNSYLKEKSEQRSQGGFFGGVSDMIVTKSTATSTSGAALSESAVASDYSTTNIQVVGVDEADIVKNDGKYIYTVSGNNVEIVEAYPASEMGIKGVINLSSSISSIFLNEDNLVVFSSSSELVPYSLVKCVEMKLGVDVKGGCGGYSSQKAMIYIYDITDRSNPVLESNISVDGNYRDARMIGDYVYLISTKSAYLETPPLSYRVDSVRSEMPIDNIYYLDAEDSGYVFTIISAINVDNGEFNSKAYLLGYSHGLYVSQDNIYLTYTKTVSQKDYYDRLVRDVFLPLLPNKEKEEVKDIVDSDKSSSEKWSQISEIVRLYSESLTGDEKADFDTGLMERMSDFENAMQKDYVKTGIHKIHVDKDEIVYETSGEVSGNVLNQFSMDESKGKFRIATTTGHVSRSGSATSLNHLYVLDEDMNVIGKVEDLAPGERIYSVRFLGDRAYIVTFKKVDPLFVIDLKDARNPKVLGYLKITGYSDYLHIYDENHVIGIGKETAGGNDDFSWYQGVKVSLFDVSDVGNPTELGKFEIGDRGTDSIALHEHKAFLFDKEKNLLVIPVSLAEINMSKYRDCNESELNDYSSRNYCLTDYISGEHVWEGAYVLNIDLSGISLRGKVTHSENVGDALNYWYGSKDSIMRSLYMDDVLYTISGSKIKANNLETLEELNSVKLPYTQRYYGYME
ncbi:MAG: beta-propeller domain-containing protein [Nanoarchaeota archaeon]